MLSLVMNGLGSSGALSGRQGLMVCGTAWCSNNVGVLACNRGQHPMVSGKSIGEISNEYPTYVLALEG